MRYTIVHRTAYRYPGPVTRSHTVVHLQPRSDLTQYCTGFSIEVSPRARIFAYTDRFANDVQHFAVLPAHDALTILAQATVVTARGPAIAPPPIPLALILADPALDDFSDFLHDSRYVGRTPQIDAFAATVGEPARTDDAVEWLRTAAAAIHAGFRYETGATTVHTALDDVVQQRAGVCQDFAHLLVALCRRIGIPARYVSGYVHGAGGSDVLGAEASHAWCEAYLGANGWVGIDPTNDTWIDDGFVRVAVGRDYGDVSPVRGIYRGPGTSTMSVDVAMAALGPGQAQLQAEAEAQQ